MRFRDVIDTFWADSATSQVFGTPYETQDGATIITVSKVRGWGNGHPPAPDEAVTGQVRVTSKPLGVFVVKGEDVKWVPAVDATRIAILGEIIGLVAATLATLAMVRRPPWPDLHGPALFVSHHHHGA
jgi:hypothetical protein